MIISASFDEKLSLLGLMVDTLNHEFRHYAEQLDIQRAVFSEVKKLKELSEKSSVKCDLLDALRTNHDAMKLHMEKSIKAHMLSRYQERIQKKTLLTLEELENKMALTGGDNEALYGTAKQWFTEREAARALSINKTGGHLTNAFAFINRAFGEGQELVIFLSDINAGFYSLKFISECGNDAYYKYNEYLLLKDQRAKLREEVLKVMEL